MDPRWKHPFPALIAGPTSWIWKTIESIVLETIAYCLSRLLIGYRSYEPGIVVMRTAAKGRRRKGVKEIRRFKRNNSKNNEREKEKKLRVKQQQYQRHSSSLT